MLTFEKIRKECEPGKTVFVGDNGVERYFVGIGVKGNLITERLDDGTASAWHEMEIKNWTIKKPTKKIRIERWMNIYPDGFASSWSSKEKADNRAIGDRIDCVHWVYEKEIEG